MAIISHAIMFPNRRADMEITFASSLIRSINPRNMSSSHMAKAPGVRAFSRGQILIKPPTYLTGAMMIAAILASIITKSPSAIGSAK